tara:strand:- start:2141 stop:2401 length:261 start_codon:yes stop_codon:yes gene_type:complete
MNGRQLAKHWTKISKQMGGFLEERFNEIVLRDMMTHDEEGMFFLFCFEEGLVGFQNIVMDELLTELSLMVLEGIQSGNLLNTPFGL